MSTHAVRVVPVALEPHPNADALSIVRVGGFQCVVRTEDWRDRRLGAYVPPDSIVPEGLVPDISGRIRAVRLRGEVSEGLLVPAPEGAEVGDDVMEALGVTHYEPAPESGGHGAPPPPIYAPSYDVENARAQTPTWPIGTALVVTEKIHGESWRAVCVDGEIHVGSRTRWKARAAHFWDGLTDEIEAWLRAHPRYVVYGEIYGATGGFPYGTAPGERRVAVFDVLAPDGRWLPWVGWLRELPTVPVLADVAWTGDLDDLAPYAEGPSTLDPSHVREGAVIRDVTARETLKLVGRGYLVGKRKRRR